MAGRGPDEIWRESMEEGERRMSRRPVGLIATGAVGGGDVMLGILALTVVSGALHVVLPEQISHIGGSLFFGIGFVLLLIGRSELFTENFLVPIAGRLNGKGSTAMLGRLWLLTMIGNLLAILVLAAMFVRAGMVPPETLEAAGRLADTFAERDFLAAFLSAIVAGTAMTLMTWLAEAVELDVSRILIGLLIGFLLAAPSLNHAIVSFGEMSFGILAGESQSADWVDLAQNFGVAVLGNLVGGVGFVTIFRVLQVSGEPA